MDLARASLVVVTLALLGCAGPAAEQGRGTAMLPSAFTGAQLHDAIHAGAVWRFRIEAAGKPGVTHVMHFTQVQSDRVEHESRTVDDGGHVVDAAPLQWDRWDTLSAHSAFPRVNTTVVRDDVVTVPAGTFHCTRYDVRDDDGSVTHFWFAAELPGPPVQWSTDKDGARLLTVTLLEHVAGA